MDETRREADEGKSKAWLQRGGGKSDDVSKGDEKKIRVRSSLKTIAMRTKNGGHARRAITRSSSRCSFYRDGLLMY
jgi:hypothetical protein